MPAPRDKHLKHNKILWSQRLDEYLNVPLKPPHNLSPCSARMLPLWPRSRVIESGSVPFFLLLFMEVFRFAPCSCLWKILRRRFSRLCASLINKDCHLSSNFLRVFNWRASWTAILTCFLPTCFFSAVPCHGLPSGVSPKVANAWLVHGQLLHARHESLWGNWWHWHRWHETCQQPFRQIAATVPPIHMERKNRRHCNFPCNALRVDERLSCSSEVSLHLPSSKQLGLSPVSFLWRYPCFGSRWIAIPAPQLPFLAPERRTQALLGSSPPTHLRSCYPLLSALRMWGSPSIQEL